jgi:hypothetical protein
MSHPGVQTVTLDANGAGQAIIAPNLLNLFWRIAQVSVNAGGAVMTVAISISGVPCTSVCTGATPLTASNHPTIDIGGHDTMTVDISAGPAGTPVVVTYYYDELQSVA